MRTGLFTTQMPDMSGLKFGTYGSGGSAPGDSRTRMCARAVAVVSAEAPHQVKGTLGGPLPGRQQTAPMDEAFAIRQLLMYTTGSVEFVTDSLGCYCRFHKLRNMTKFQIQRLAGAHVWADIRGLLLTEMCASIGYPHMVSLVLPLRRLLIGCWLLMLLLTRRLAGRLTNAIVERCCSVGARLFLFLMTGLCRFSKLCVLGIWCGMIC